MASDVSEVKTIAISDKISKQIINEIVACGYRLKKGINISRRCVNGYSITAAPANSVTHVSFRWCVYQRHCDGGKCEEQPVVWATGSVEVSVGGYPVP